MKEGVAGPVRGGVDQFCQVVMNSLMGKWRTKISTRSKEQSNDLCPSLKCYSSSTFFFQ